MNIRMEYAGMEITEKIADLRRQINYHSEKYYNQDAPEITDYEVETARKGAS